MLQSAPEYRRRKGKIRRSDRLPLFAELIVSALRGPHCGAISWRPGGPMSPPERRGNRLVDLGDVVLPPKTSERGPLLLVTCLIGIVDCLNRLNVFGYVTWRQVVLPATC